MKTASNRIERDMGDRCRVIKLKSFSDSKWIQVDQSQAQKVMGKDDTGWKALRALDDLPPPVNASSERWTLDVLSNWVTSHK